MEQITQVYKTGKLQLVDVSAPALRKGSILVRNVNSLVSTGTEKYMLEMAKKSLVGKALARPDLVKQVIAKVKAEGVLEAYKVTMARLDCPVALGYSCAGVVVDIADNVEGFSRGDRVACVGSGHASHAEVVCVPQNLCVKIPENVDFESASFVALGGIALQAVRMANPVLGDKVAVIGLGLLGQITIQLLKAAGCHVFGIDISEQKVNMALENGVERAAVSEKNNILCATREFAPNGFDSVIIMAATKSNNPLELAADIATERARIVAAGLVGLDIPRKAFFEKELELVVSRAWGPGVFDPLYSEKSIDYPYAYVRWTAQRNLEEFIYLLSRRLVKVNHLITHRFPIENALEAYEMVLKDNEPHIGVLITYPDGTVRNEPPKIIHLSKRQKSDQPYRGKPHRPVIGFIGAGLFATGTLLPILKSLNNVRLKGVATATGIKAQYIAKKFGLEYFTTDYKELLRDDEIDLIFVLRRHGSHAHSVIEALKAGKNVFVEKPLCTNLQQLKQLVSTFNQIASRNQILMVGFNRRFSPLSAWLKEKFRMIREPISIHCTINAGYIPPEHWVHDTQEGAGRIVGEICHYIDLIQFFTDSTPTRVSAEAISLNSCKPSDNVSVTLKMKNGSIGSIFYVASGDKRYPRERIEIFGGGAVGVIDNFKKTIFVNKGKKESIKKWCGLDMGHKREMEILISSIREKTQAPVPFEDYISTTLATFAIEQSLREGTPKNISFRERIAINRWKVKELVS